MYSLLSIQISISITGIKSCQIKHCIHHYFRYKMVELIMLSQTSIRLKLYTFNQNIYGLIELLSLMSANFKKKTNNNQHSLVGKCWFFQFVVSNTYQILEFLVILFSWLCLQESFDQFISIIIIIFSCKMSLRGSPIKGLQPTIKEFTLQSYALSAQNQRLTQLLISKNNEIRTLVETNAKIKNTYQAQANAYRKTITSLEKQITENDTSRQQQFNFIKQEYDRLNKDSVSSLKTSHTNEIQFLFKQIAHLRASIETYDAKIQVRDHEVITIKESYERELAMNTSEINTLNKKIMQLEDDKSRQIKDLTNKRQLERSRTSGVVNSKKESNQYIEKQLRKLNEQVLQKTINIQNITRELNKEKKKYQDTVKSMNQKNQSIIQDYQKQIAENLTYFNKIQKILKDQILQYKEKQVKLMNENESLKSFSNALKKQIQTKDAIVKVKSEQIFSLKNSAQKMRQDHINEINNLMKQRRKRSSKSNLGSSRSLTSSLKESAIVTTPMALSAIEQEQLSHKLASFLPIVKEQSSPQRKDLSNDLSRSNILQEQNENQLARAIFHYDSMIDQLKKSHVMEIQYYKMTLESSKSKLKQKESQLEDVLTRFSPLVKIHTEEKSLQQDRKERIERHWKADLGILEIMLRKYKIMAF